MRQHTTSTPHKTIRTLATLAAMTTIIISGCAGEQLPAEPTPAEASAPDPTPAPTPLDEHDDADETAPSTTGEEAGEGSEPAGGEGEAEEDATAEGGVLQQRAAATAGSGDGVADVRAAMDALASLGMECTGPTPAEIPGGEELQFIQAAAECVGSDGDDAYAFLIVTDEDTDPDAYWEQEFLLADVSAYLEEEALAAGGSPNELHGTVNYTGPYAYASTYEDRDRINDALENLRP